MAESVCPKCGRETVWVSPPGYFVCQHWSVSEPARDACECGIPPEPHPSHFPDAVLVRAGMARAHELSIRSANSVLPDMIRAALDYAERVDGSDEAVQTACEALDALVAERDRLADEAETYRAALTEIADYAGIRTPCDNRHCWPCRTAALARAALSDSKEEE